MRGSLSIPLVHTLGVAGLALLLVGGYVLGVQSSIDARNEAWDVRQRIASADRARRDIERRTEALRSEIASIQGDALAGGSLRPVSERNELLADLVRLASGQGVVVDKATPGEAEDAGSMVRTAVRLIGRGRLLDLLALLGDIYETMPGVHVLGLRFDSDPFRDDPGSISIDLAWYAERNG